LPDMNFSVTCAAGSVQHVKQSRELQFTDTAVGVSEILFCGVSSTFWNSCCRV